MHVFFAAAVLTGVATCSLAAAADGSPTCTGGPHSRVIVTRPQVVLLHDPTNYGAPDRLCDRATGRRTALAFPLSVVVGGGRPDHVAQHSLVIIGRRIAYAWDDNEGTGGHSGLNVVDARSGDQRQPVLNKGGHYTRFRRLVLTRSGALAWSEKGKVGYIRTCDRACMQNDRATPRTVARGRSVEPDSLRGVRGGVSWRQGGRIRRISFS